MNATATARTPLTIRSLMVCLGVSHMTVIAWGRGIPRHDNEPMPRTAVALARWAKRHGVKLLKDPQKLALNPAKPSRQLAAPRTRKDMSPRAAKRSRAH